MATKDDVPARFSPVAGLTRAERAAVGFPDTSNPQGGPKPARGNALLRRMAAKAVTPHDLEVAARALGYVSAEDAELDGVDTLEALLLWQVTRAALMGDRIARSEVLDRIAPKPKRVILTGGDGGPVRLTAVPPGAGSGPDAQAAADYFASLDDVTPDPTE